MTPRQINDLADKIRMAVFGTISEQNARIAKAIRKAMKQTRKVKNAP